MFVDLLACFKKLKTLLFTEKDKKKKERCSIVVSIQGANEDMFCEKKNQISFTEVGSISAVLSSPVCVPPEKQLVIEPTSRKGQGQPTIASVESSWKSFIASNVMGDKLLLNFGAKFQR